MAELDPRRPDERDAGAPTGHEHERSPRRSATVGRDAWPASASFGWLIGTALLFLCALAVVFLLVRVPGSSGGQRIAWIAIVVALTALTIGIAILLRALPTMRYRLTDDALIVEWLGERRVVRYDEISDVTFEPRRPLRLPRWEPFWPGYYVATVRTPSGVWHSWATQQPHRRVRLTTSRGIVAISPERPVRFISELDRRMRALHSPAERPDQPPAGRIDSPPPAAIARPASVAAGADRGSGRRPSLTARRSVTPRSAPSRITQWAAIYRDLFRDRLLTDQLASALVAVAVVLPVLMVAYLYSQYEGLPEQIPIRWDASGDIASMSTPRGLWRFPRIAITIMVVNTALATLLIAIDRYLSRLLLAAVPLAQVILFVALVRAVN